MLSYLTSLQALAAFTELKDTMTLKYKTEFVPHQPFSNFNGKNL